VLVDVGGVHPVVHDGEVGTTTVDLGLHAQRQDVGVLLVGLLPATGTQGGGEDDLGRGPRLGGGLPATIGGVGKLELDVVRGGQHLLDVVDDGLRQRLTRGDDEDPERGVHAQPEHHVLGQGGGLRVLGGHVDEQTVPVRRLVGLGRVEVAGLAALQHVDPLVLVPERVLVQILLPPVGKPHTFAAVGLVDLLQGHRLIGQGTLNAGSFRRQYSYVLRDRPALLHTPTRLSSLP
jgi:hypothetical protein